MDNKDLLEVLEELKSLKKEVHTNRRILLNIGRKSLQFSILGAASALFIYTFNSLDEPTKTAVKQNWLTNGVIAVLSSAAIRETFFTNKLKKESDEDEDDQKENK